MKKFKFKPQYITVIVFVLLVFGLTLFNLFTPVKMISEMENRPLAQMPKFSINELFKGDFTADFETFVTDQFVWRNFFVGVKTQTEHLLGKQDTNGVYFAKDNFLIEKQDDSFIDSEQAERNLGRLVEFAESYQQKLGEGHVKVMLVPTAITVLSDKLPSYAPSYDQKAMLDGLAKRLPKNVYVDVLSALEEKNDEYIFYKTDHHWTTLGAYYGYRKYCESVGIDGTTAADYDVKEVSSEFYGTVYSKARLLKTKPDRMFAYIPKVPQSLTLDYNMGEKQETSLYQESYLEKRDKYSYFLGGNHPLIKIDTGVKNGKKLLVVKDSYSHCFAPFLTSDYETIYMVDLRKFNISLSQFAEDEGITDALVLYNTVNYLNDTNVLKLVR